MKKIIDKLKANKKALKILLVVKCVLDCFVYGFAIFMIIGLALGQSRVHNERELIPNEVNEPVKKAYSPNQEEYLFTYVDFNSSEFLSSMVIDLQTNYGTIEHSIAYSPVQVYVSKWTNTEIVTRPDTKGMINFIDQSQVTLITNITLNYTGRNVVNNVMYFTWTLDFYRSDNSRMLTYTIMAFPGYMDGTTTEWFNLGQGIPTGLVFSTDSVSRFSEYVFLIGDYEATYPYNHVLVDHLNVGLDYSNGYNYGYTLGENAGYQRGYQDGQAANMDMFSLIEQAFISIGGILNIQIIPGLTLGVLMFTPIVVLIIIVVFKMVKG